MRWIGRVLLLPIVIAGWYLVLIGYGSTLFHVLGALFLSLILIWDLFSKDPQEDILRFRRFVIRFVKPY